MGKEENIGFISNVEQSTAEFYTSNLEENINIALSQHRVSRTNPVHYLLIDNTERKVYEIGKS
jgi:hypothetical protein